MSFSPFAYQGYWRTIDTGVQAKGGSFTLSESMDIAQIILTIFIRGTISGTERLRLKIYGANSAAGTSSPIATSAWFDLSDIGSYTGNWIGDVPMDFSGEPLNGRGGTSYYVSIESGNYTRNNDDFYIAVNLDWYPAVNTPLVETTAGFKMRILGYK